MFLVNSIAEILHTNVHSRYGSANKNIGDAFLLVWRSSRSESLSNLSPDARPAAYTSSPSGGIMNMPPLELTPGATTKSASHRATLDATSKLDQTAGGKTNQYQSGGKQQGSVHTNERRMIQEAPASPPQQARANPLDSKRAGALIAPSLTTPLKSSPMPKKLKMAVSDEVLAANALNSFLHTMKDMGESIVLQAIGKKAPKYAPIKMGYGLHVGWGIEVMNLILFFIFSSSFCTWNIDENKNQHK
jgi:hypothetical protein